MAKLVSTIARGMIAGTGILKKLAEAIEDLGGSDDDLRRIETDDELRRKIAELVVGSENCFRVTDDDVVIEIPALPRPTLDELCEFGVKEIESDASPTGPVTLRLATVLATKENDIDGKTYERRIAAKRNQSLVLGYQHAKWLRDNQKQFPALMALLGNVYIDFSGLVVVREYGYRYVPYLNDWDDRQWHLNWSWIDHRFLDHGRLAVSSK